MSKKCLLCISLSAVLIIIYVLKYKSGGFTTSQAAFPQRGLFFDGCHGILLLVMRMVDCRLSLDAFSCHGMLLVVIRYCWLPTCHGILALLGYRDFKYKHFLNSCQLPKI